MAANGRTKEAFTDFDAAIAVRESLSPDLLQEASHRLELGQSHLAKGHWLSESRPDAARIQLDKAVAILQKLATDVGGPSECKRDLGRAYFERARCWLRTQKPEQAVVDLNRAVQLETGLATKDPNDREINRDLGRSQHWLGNALESLRRFNEAKSAYDKAIELRGKLLDSDPGHTDYRHELAASYNNRAQLLFKVDSQAAAIDDFSMAIRHFSRLAEELPFRHDLAGETAGNCLNLAQIHFERGEAHAAKKRLGESWPHVVRLSKAMHNDSRLRRLVQAQVVLAVKVHAELLEITDAIHAAEFRRDIGWNRSEDAFEAAEMLAVGVRLLKVVPGLESTLRVVAMDQCGKAVVAMLDESIKNGFNDSSRILQNPNLDAIVGRTDFSQLVAKLGRKSMK